MFHVQILKVDYYLKLLSPLPDLLGTMPSLLQVRQYKHERECNSVIQQSREDKIVRLEALMGGVLPRETFLSEEWAALLHEHKVHETEL